MSIIIENKWLVIVCLLAAAIPPFLLYYRSSFYSENKRLFYFLFVLRYLAFFFLFFFLLEPLIKTVYTREEKPLVVVLTDNSLSIKSAKDSLEIVKKVKSLSAEINSKLNDDYETHAYRFGTLLNEGIDSLNFNDKVTDIDNAFNEISSRYYNRNLGAVILLSDGIYNKGKNPLNRIKQMKNVSIYSIGLGDTLIAKDILIADFLYNKTAFLGNDYPVEIVINAKKLNGSRTEISIYDNGLEVGKRDFAIQTPNQILRFSFLIPAKTEGIHKITAKIKPVDGEFTIKNNEQSVYINVVKNKQQILLLAYAPHPDISAIKYALESSQNYKVNSQVFQQGNNYKFRDYNLVILHQLPTALADEEMLRQLKNSGVPSFYIIGNATNLTLLTKNTGVLSINASGKSLNNALPVVNSSFLNFSLNEKTKNSILKYPPLQAPFGEYRISPGAIVLLYQKIGAVTTAQPLLLFNKEGMNGKTGILCGEGCWNWKMKDFDFNGNNDAFNEIIQKSVQFLCVAENKSYFRVTHKNEFTENEPILFDAELFNDNYEPVNEPDVNMIIINADKKEFKSVFSKAGKTYRLNAGMLPPGEYAFEASTQYNKKDFTRKGKFNITAVNNELLRTEADHRLLYQMAKGTGGEFYNTENALQVINDIKKNKNMTALAYTEKSLDDIINIKWLIAIPVILLALEWFLRKRAGEY